MMYLFINLAFLLFILFIFLKIFSLFKKIFDFIIKKSEKNANFSEKDAIQNENSANKSVTSEKKLGNIRQFESKSAEKSSPVKEVARDNSSNDFKKRKKTAVNKFSSNNDPIFSQFDDYTEAEKAIIYSEIISQPKSKQNKFTK